MQSLLHGAEAGLPEARAAWDTAAGISTVRPWSSADPVFCESAGLGWPPTSPDPPRRVAPPTLTAERAAEARAMAGESAEGSREGSAAAYVAELNERLAAIEVIHAALLPAISAIMPSDEQLHEMLAACIDLRRISSENPGCDGPAVEVAIGIAAALIHHAVRWMLPQHPILARNWDELQSRPAQWREEVMGKIALANQLGVLPQEFATQIINALCVLNDGRGTAPGVLKPFVHPDYGIDPREIESCERALCVWVEWKAKDPRTKGNARDEAGRAAGLSAASVKSWDRKWRERDGADGVEAVYRIARQFGVQGRPPPGRRSLNEWGARLRALRDRPLDINCDGIALHDCQANFCVWIEWRSGQKGATKRLAIDEVAKELRVPVAHVAAWSEALRDRAKADGGARQVAWVDSVFKVARQFGAEGRPCPGVPSFGVIFERWRSLSEQAKHDAAPASKPARKATRTRFD